MITSRSASIEMGWWMPHTFVAFNPEWTSLTSVFAGPIDASVSPRARSLVRRSLRSRGIAEKSFFPNHFSQWFCACLRSTARRQHLDFSTAVIQETHTTDACHSAQATCELSCARYRAIGSHTKLRSHYEQRNQPNDVSLTRRGWVIHLL